MSAWQSVNLQKVPFAFSNSPPSIGVFFASASLYYESIIPLLIALPSLCQTFCGCKLSVAADIATVSKPSATRYKQEQLFSLFLMPSLSLSLSLSLSVPSVASRTSHKSHTQSSKISGNFPTNSRTRPIYTPRPSTQQVGIGGASSRSQQHRKTTNKYSQPSSSRTLPIYQHFPTHFSRTSPRSHTHAARKAAQAKHRKAPNFQEKLPQIQPFPYTSTFLHISPDLPEISHTRCTQSCTGKASQSSKISGCTALKKRSYFMESGLLPKRFAGTFPGTFPQTSPRTSPRSSIALSHTVLLTHRLHAKLHRQSIAKLQNLRHIPALSHTFLQTSHKSHTHAARKAAQAKHRKAPKFQDALVWGSQKKVLLPLNMCASNARQGRHCCEAGLFHSFEPCCSSSVFVSFPGQDFC